ncbi:19055_t:CDS:2 [Cetraspora pellucida]|uniref:19055_t:CDS:1 n=1 Tax=Cetraspora pellucida TaxID=1433469 RepID=A0A9N9EDM7_9GLOM|nr:19055_t:CDS:2 [Cetraspora pellucida]
MITNGILQIQAKKFAELLDISEENFKASQDWLDRFKKWHDIRRFKIHRESESVSTEKLPEYRQQLGIQKENLGVKYDASQKAWMTESYESSHIRLHLLLPYTTSCLQPCDAGIIYTFKAYYQKLFLQNLVNALNNKEEIPKLSILDAIKFITEAWDNNWSNLNARVRNKIENEVETKAEIKAEVEREAELKEAEFEEVETEVEEVETEVEEAKVKEVRVEEEVEQLILKIPYHLMRVITANNYIEPDNNLETEEVTVNKAAIIEEICHQSDFSNSNEDSDVKIEKISHSVALEQCKLLILYVEQQDPMKFVKDQNLPVLQNLLK